MPARGERGGQRAGEKKCHVKIFLALLENLNFFPQVSAVHVERYWCGLAGGRPLSPAGLSPGGPGTVVGPRVWLPGG